MPRITVPMRNPLLDTLWASMRPGRNAPDNDLVTHVFLRHVNASMRPGRNAPDNVSRVSREFCYTCVASMRPGRNAPDNDGRARRAD